MDTVSIQSRHDATEHDSLPGVLIQRTLVDRMDATLVESVLTADLLRQVLGLPRGTMNLPQGPSGFGLEDLCGHVHTNISDIRSLATTLRDRIGSL